MAAMNDIAKQLGISKDSVSKALNGGIGSGVPPLKLHPKAILRGSVPARPKIVYRNL